MPVDGEQPSGSVRPNRFLEKITMKTYTKMIAGVLAFALAGVFAAVAQEAACPKAAAACPEMAMACCGKADCCTKADCCVGGKKCEPGACAQMACCKDPAACPMAKMDAAACPVKPEAKPAKACNPERCKKCLDPEVLANNCCCTKKKPAKS